MSQAKQGQANKRIITVAVDEWPESQKALKWTLQNIVNPQTDALQILSVAPHDTILSDVTAKAQGSAAHEELPSEPRMDESKNVANLRQVLSNAEKEVTECNANKDQKVHFTVHPVKGPSAREDICVFAKNHRTDLLVVGCWGSSGMRRAIMGSTAEYVVRNAPCPVLVVREVEA